MIEAKFFTVGTYLYKYNLTVLFVSPSKIAHDKFYIYCPPLLLNEIYAHDYRCTVVIPDKPKTGFEQCIHDGALIMLCYNITNSKR